MGLFFRLSLIFFVFSASLAQASDCIRARLQKQFELESEALESAHGVSTIFYEPESGRPDFDAVYVRRIRKVVFNAKITDPALRLHIIRHESVHAETDTLIRTDFTAKNAVRAIEFLKEGGEAIHEDLPNRRYSHYFTYDEWLAYRASADSAWELESRGITQGFPFIISKREFEYSARFHKVGHELLTRLKSEISRERETGIRSLGVAVDRYDIDVENVKVAKIKIRAADGWIQINVPFQARPGQGGFSRREILSSVEEILKNGL